MLWYTAATFPGGGTSLEVFADSAIDAAVRAHNLISEAGTPEPIVVHNVLCAAEYFGSSTKKEAAPCQIPTDTKTRQPSTPEPGTLRPATPSSGGESDEASAKEEPPPAGRPPQPGTHDSSAPTHPGSVSRIRRRRFRD